MGGVEGWHDVHGQEACVDDAVGFMHQSGMLHHQSEGGGSRYRSRSAEHVASPDVGGSYSQHRCNGSDGGADVIRRRHVAFQGGRDAIRGQDITPCTVPPGKRHKVIRLGTPFEPVNGPASGNAAAPGRSQHTRDWVAAEPRYAGKRSRQGDDLTPAVVQQRDQNVRSYGNNVRTGGWVDNRKQGQPKQPLFAQKD
eukprot:jgi/Chrzof1/2366/Cz11g12140.t1